MTLAIEPTGPADLSAIEALYPAAFPDENLLPVVRALLVRDDVLSLAARVQGDGRGAHPAPALAGHIAFTLCGTDAAPGALALLAPLAVAPAHQRQGIGTALIRHGLDLLKARGVQVVLVLGDPAYYGRHGFAIEVRITPPYPMPTEWLGAWQSLSLGSNQSPLTGQVQLPDVWMKPELWLP